MKRLPQKGFTLVELLVVVAVIAILAAVLFPVFFAAREKARASACLSNYHQVGLAVQQYAADFDDHTPPDGGSFSGLVADCLPYTRSTAVFACPDDFDRIREGRAGTYRMPSLYQGLPLSCGWPDPYAAGRVSRSSTTFLCYEAEQDYAESEVLPTYRHHGGAQILFFDGHARWIRGHGAKDDDD